MRRKELIERVSLLEYENGIMMEKLKKLIPLIPVNDNEIPSIDTNTYLSIDPMSYKALRRKYRDYKIIFNNEL